MPNQPKKPQGLINQQIPISGQINKNFGSQTPLGDFEIPSSGRFTEESILANPPLGDQEINPQLGNPDTSRYEDYFTE